MIEAKVILDSVGPNQARLITVCLTYPRFAHAELMTHRVFSRNASSSRAIPVKRQIQMVIDNPAVPLAFTKNQRGMQGGEALQGDQYEAALRAWFEGRDRAVEVANKLADLEVHKQYANRVLEPYAHITVVVTSTEWDNFFALRYHPDALPEMQELARLLYAAIKASKPKKLKAGEWHIPFIPDNEPMSMDAFKVDDNGIINLVKISAARCARVSYLNHEGKTPTVREDLDLHDKLVGEKKVLSGEPLHASPAEHQAMAVGDPAVRSGNFRGWIQYRKTIPGECCHEWRHPNED